MKLILSRKGFDSSAGGVPSPILPDGCMVSLPIPDRQSVISYRDISFDGGSLGSLLSALTCGQIPPHYGAHIDPDLAYGSLPRLPGWRPLFGQTGSAQSHLRNQTIGPGDLFLFFGLFRRVQLHDGVYSWATGSRPCHVIWGWLQVAEVLHVDSMNPTEFPWALYHPHFHRGADANNALYLARPHLGVGRLTHLDLPGARVFPHFSASQLLTARDQDRPTVWDLPGWFHPSQERAPLTYHSDPVRWEKCGQRTRLESVGRGQEFVLDCADYPEAIDWVCDLLDQTGKQG